MKTDMKVQFVCFETTLDKEPFMKRWEQYTHSSNSNKDVTIQQSEGSGVYRYVAQHRYETGELQFVFARESRSSRIAQVQITTSQAGGYSVLQEECEPSATGSDYKIFVFLQSASIDLDDYRSLTVPNRLNIYEAYYENCKYAYILEYVVKPKDAAGLVAQVKQDDDTKLDIYKEFPISKNAKNDKEKDFYVWPIF